MGKKKLVSAMPRLTTHSTGARVSLHFIENLNLSALTARPVNSGVRHASRKQDSSGLSDEAQKTKRSVEGFQSGAV